MFPINILLETIDYLVMMACIIQNLLRDEHGNYSTNYLTENNGSIKLMTNTMPSNVIRRNLSHEAIRIRESFNNYFNNRARSVGSLDKQVTRS